MMEKTFTQSKKMKLDPDNLIFCDGGYDGKTKTEYYAFIVLTKDGRWFERCNKRPGRTDNRQLHELLAVQKAREFHHKYLKGFTIIYSDYAILYRAINGNGKFFGKKRPFKKETEEIRKDTSIRVRGIQYAPCTLPYRLADYLCKQRKIVRKEHEGFPDHFHKDRFTGSPGKRPKWRTFENYFEFFKHCHA